MPPIDPLDLTMINTLVLNQIFVRPLNEKTMQLVFNIIRRVDLATNEYAAARTFLVQSIISSCSLVGWLLTQNNLFR
jgi:hypothetical protein